MSPTETGRFRRAGSGEWLVYGNRDRMSQAQKEQDFRAISPEEMVNSGLFFADFGPDDPQGELRGFSLSPRPLSPPPAGPYGRFGKADSGEWLAYGNSSAGRLSKAASDERVTAFRPRDVPSPAQRPLSPDQTEYQVFQSLSPSKVRTGGGLFDLRKRTVSPPSSIIVKKTSSKEAEKLRKRQLSPPEVQKKLVFTRGAEKKTSGKNFISSLGKLVKSAKGKSKEGGRVISSSDGPIGSQEGGAKKERISVCKMAAINMSKERSQEKKD